MKSLIKILGLLFTFSQFSFSQNTQCIIPLSPAIGDTLDANEKEYYHLYSQYQKFQQMVIYTNGDSSVTIIIEYLDSDDNLKDTVMVKDLTFIESLKIQINKIYEDSKQEVEELKINNYQRIIVTTRLDSNYASYLYEVIDTGIYVFLEEELLKENSSNQIEAVFAHLNTLKSITIDESEKDSQTFLYGVIGLTAFFAMAGFASGDDPPEEFFSFTAGQKALYGGLLGAILGTIVGLFVLLDNDEIIEINSDKDLEKLKAYVKK